MNIIDHQLIVWSLQHKIPKMPKARRLGKKNFLKHKDVEEYIF